MRSFHALVAVVLAVAALPVSAQEETPFRSTGEVEYRTTAAYDATRVRGPKVNMALTKDGKWGGSIQGQDVLLEVKPGRISGAGVNLVVSQDATTVSAEGLLSGIRVRVKATKDSFVGRVGDRQVECERRADGYWILRGGPAGMAAIRFKGTADKMPDVPMPQWIFAIIGAI
jgi:hypothetical protein